MALYDDLIAVDIITPIQDAYKVRYTTELEPVVYLEAVYIPSPWIHYKLRSDRQCAVWFGIYFKKYGFIPKACRQCWKVVMSIPTLTELFEINQSQEGGTYNSKCGLETRGITGGLGGYRAFWYAPINGGLKAGRKMFKHLQKKYPGVKLMLKRGCTEFEASYHPSDQWDKLAEENSWDMRERLVNTLFITQKTQDDGTPKVLHPSIIRKWIEWAYEHHKSTGDDSWRNYLEGPPMPDYQTYHSSNHKDEDYEPADYFYPRETLGHIQEYHTSEGPSMVEDEVGGLGAEKILIQDFQKN